MRVIKRNILSTLMIGFAMLTSGYGIILCSVGIYYILITLVVIGFTIFYESKISLKRREMKKVAKIINYKSSTTPLEVEAFGNWLKKEGFTLRMNTIGKLYLQSKTVEIRYYSTLEDKLSVSSIKPNDKDYTTYADNEELKMKLIDYLGFLTERNISLMASEGRFARLNANAVYHTSEKVAFSQETWNISIRLQGYIFLVIGLLNVPEENFPNIAKFMIIGFYFIIENIFMIN